MTHRELTESLLKIFAARATAELERMRAEEALRHSESSYRSIFEASEDPIFVHDWDTGEILDVSPKAEELYGWTRAEMRRLRVADVSANEPGYTQAEAARHIQQAKLHATPVRFEWHARHRDGHLMWHEVTLKRATIAGEPQILAFIRDVTERKRADEALRASEEQYRAVFHATADGLVLRDADNCIVDVNPALLAMTGYTREDLVGARRWLFVRPNEDEEAAARARRVLAGETSHRETQAVRKDGTPFDVEVRSVPIQYRGRPHVLAMAREITARRLADEALRASEEQYRAVFNATADALVLRDADNCIVDVNPALLAMTGYAREDLVGKQRWAFLPPEKDALGRELHRRVIAGEPVQHETVGVRKDGTRFDVEVRSVPIQYRGRPHVLAMARDITARRLADEALRASEAQYRAIFNATADALVLRDADFRIVDVNPAYEAMSGYTREEVLGVNQVVAHPVQVNEQLLPLHRKALAGERDPPRDRGPAQGRHADRDRAARRADPASGRAARALHRPRHHLAPARRDGAGGARDAAPPGAEDGGDRPPRRRDRARLQQHPDEHHGLRRARGRAAGRDRGSQARQLPRAGAALEPAGARPDPADAHVQPRPARRAAAGRPAARRRGGGAAAALVDAVDARAGNPGRRRRAAHLARPRAGRAGAAQPLHQCPRRAAGARQGPRRRRAAARAAAECARAAARTSTASSSSWRSRTTARESRPR